MFMFNYILTRRLPFKKKPFRFEGRGKKELAMPFSQGAKTAKNSE